MIDAGNHSGVICDFFVPFNRINHSYVNRVHGYWGQIADIGRDYDTIWLNSGGRYDVSLCLPERIQRDFFDRFEINDPEDLVDSYILYLGTLKASSHNKNYIVIDKLALVTCY